MEHAEDEVKRLEGCINDLASVVALPAIWSGREPASIVTTLLDALLGMARLDFAYARLSAAGGEARIEIVRPARDGPGPEAIATALGFSPAEALPGTPKPSPIPGAMARCPSHPCDWGSTATSESFCWDPDALISRPGQSCSFFGWRRIRRSSGCGKPVS
jgi:hypothetical protein